MSAKNLVGELLTSRLRLHHCLW